MNQRRKRPPEALEDLVSPDEAADTKSRLVAGATECLRRYGLRGTTSRAITAAAGANLGAITYYFGSKDELVAQALLETVRGWLAPAMAILKEDIEPDERMIRAVGELQRTFTEARDMLSVYLDALVSASRNDTLKRGIAELFMEVRSFLAAQLRAQRVAGTLPDWVDPDAFAMLLVATADGIGLHAAIEPEAVQPNELAAQAIQLLLASRGTS